MDPPLIKGIFNALYGDVPARFSSEFPLTESVARLREHTGRSIFASLFHESAVGPVTESRAVTLLFPIIGLGFFVVGIVFIRFCWWLSRSDIAYLSSVIQQALAQGPSGSALGPEA